MTTTTELTPPPAYDDEPHIARAVSAEQTVYVLHSTRCKESGIDLRECPTSIALAHGIDLEWWQGWEDKPVVLTLWGSPLRLRPLRDAVAPEAGDPR